MTNYVYEDSYKFTREYLPQEFPLHGTTDYRQPAIIIEQENGSNISSFSYKSHQIFLGKKKLEALPATYVEEDEEAKSLVITLEDQLTGIEVDLSYTIFANYPAISRHTKVRNEGNQTVFISQIMSLSLDLPQSDNKLLQLSGAWGRERIPKLRSLEVGTHSISSNRGNSSHHHNPFVALIESSANEHQGEVIGFSLVYSGNFLAEIEIDNFQNLRLNMGINPENFSWKLEPLASFQTPELVFVYSSEGINHMSQTYHKIYRKRLARGYWRDRERPILINNWEATGMNFTHDSLISIAKKAKECGVELFVLDDGWFGSRRNDRAGLGDWVASSEVLPKGLSSLSDEIHEIGLDFGLWFEPEMVNKDSDLYRKHPD